MERPKEMDDACDALQKVAVDLGGVLGHIMTKGGIGHNEASNLIRALDRINEAHALVEHASVATGFTTSGTFLT